MTGQYQFARGSLTDDGTIDQPDDAAVGFTADNGKFTEVLVERDENPSLIPGSREDRGVARVGRPITGPDDIMTQVAECDCCLS